MAHVRIDLPSIFLATLVGGCVTSPIQARPFEPEEVLGNVGAAGVGLYKGKFGPPDAKGNYRKLICALPPAQAAVELKVTTTGKAAVKVKEVEVSGEVARAIEQGASRLFEQNEQTLFVQHTLYRLCEANANGMLDGISAREILVGDRLAAEQELERWKAELDDATRLESIAAADFARAEKALKGVDDKINEARARLDKVKTTEKSVEELAKLDQERARLQTDLDVEKDALVSARSRLSRVNTEHLVAAKLVDGLATAIRELDESGKTDVVGRGSAYGALFNKIFVTATRLSEIDVDRHRALADRAKAEADKAKADLEKSKGDAEKVKAEKAKVEAKLEELQRALVDASVSRARCTADCGKEDDGKEKAEKDGEKKEPK